MHIKLLTMLLVILSAVCAFAVPSPNSISGESAQFSDSNDESNAFAFVKQIVKQAELDTVLTKGPCGWASSASACSSACYILGWGWYTFWFATGQCCCS